MYCPGLPSLKTLLAGEQLEDGCVLAHDTLEVLVLTRCWAGEHGFALRYVMAGSMHASSMASRICVTRG